MYYIKWKTVTVKKTIRIYGLTQLKQKYENI